MGVEALAKKAQGLLSQVIRKAGQDEQAAAPLKKLRERLARKPSLALVAAAYTNIAIFCFNQNQFTQAIKSVGNAIAIFRKQPDAASKVEQCLPIKSKATHAEASRVGGAEALALMAGLVDELDAFVAEHHSVTVHFEAIYAKMWVAMHRFELERTAEGAVGMAKECRLLLTERLSVNEARGLAKTHATKIFQALRTLVDLFTLREEEHEREEALTAMVEVARRVGARDQEALALCELGDAAAARACLSSNKQQDVSVPALHARILLLREEGEEDGEVLEAIRGVQSRLLQHVLVASLHMAQAVRSWDGGDSASALKKATLALQQRSALLTSLSGVARGEDGRMAAFLHKSADSTTLTRWRFAHDLATALRTVADCYERQGSVRQAEYYYQKGIELGTEMKDCAPNVLRRFKAAQASVRGHKNEFDASHALLRDETDADSKVDDDIAAESRLIRGDVHVREQRYQDAELHFSLLSDIPLDGWPDFAERRIAEMYVGEARAMGSVEDGLELLEQLFDRLPEYGDAADALVHRGEPTLHRIRLFFSMGVAYVKQAIAAGLTVDMWAAAPSSHTAAAAPQQRTTRGKKSAAARTTRTRTRKKKTTKNNDPLAKARESLRQAWEAAWGVGDPIVTKDIAQTLADLSGRDDPDASFYYLNACQGITARHEFLAVQHQQRQEDERGDEEEEDGVLGDITDRVGNVRIDDNDDGAQAKKKEKTVVAGDAAAFLRFDADDRKRTIQRLEALPEEWSVCSLFVSNDLRYMYVTRLDHGASKPFVMRFDDADLEHGILASFRAIMHENDRTIESAKGVKTTKEKKAWWEARTTVDARIGALVQDIEALFGAWTGVFRGAPRSAHARQRLDEAVVDIIARVDALTDEHADLVRVLLLGRGCGSEHLEEAVAWVMNGDVGDADVVEAAALIREKAVAVGGGGGGGGEGDEEHPVILILSKQLQRLPWESMPCARTTPISRMPSLAFLLARLPLAAPPVEGVLQLVDASNTFFVLNPDGDLVTTEETFAPVFESRDGWSGCVGAAQRPSQEAYTAALEDKDLIVYCGHSAGEQVLRSDDLKKVRCRAVAFLMGCSSGRLEYHGDYEPSGMTLAYMIAQSPAVVANLWDVTDRDIDKFSKACLLDCWLQHDGCDDNDDNDDERKQARKRTGEKAKTPAPRTRRRAATRTAAAKKARAPVAVAVGGDARSVGPVSLSAAVAKARHACNLRYLNGSAPVCYGLPVAASYCAK